MPGLGNGPVTFDLYIIFPVDISTWITISDEASQFLAVARKKIRFQKSLSY